MWFLVVDPIRCHRTKALFSSLDFFPTSSCHVLLEISQAGRFVELDLNQHMAEDGEKPWLNDEEFIQKYSVIEVERVFSFWPF